jgi:RNA polymerase sigma factor (sigma-70 family)
VARLQWVRLRRSVGAVPARASPKGLVARCRAGDDDAWRELVEGHARYVHAIAVRGYRLQPADAEDVFQETFARAYEHLDRLRDDDAIGAWIGQVARRLALARLRAQSREAPAGDEGMPDAAELDARLERIDDAVSVHAAMASLSGDCREVLDRFFAGDDSYAAIAEALDVPPGTVASRISRCLTKLRAKFVGSKRTAARS